MVVDILLLIAGLILIIAGANYLTEGSETIAKRFGVSELVIGLTVVAIGTSMPEFVVSVTSAIKGNTEMAVGNVIGSNIFNVFVILGITTIIAPITLTKENIKSNIPSVLVASLLFLISSAALLRVKFMPERINWISGVVYVLCFVGFLMFSIKKSHGGNLEENAEHLTNKNAHVKVSDREAWIAVPVILAALVALVFGGNLFLDKAVILAKAMGMSDYVISATLMAAGTSLPELATSIVAAKKGHPQMALGNVLGSNVTNILLILGVSSLIKPLEIGGISPLDIILVVLAPILLMITPFTFKRHAIDRVEGIILILIYMLYVASLLNVFN